MPASEILYQRIGEGESGCGVDFDGESTGLARF